MLFLLVLIFCLVILVFQIKHGRLIKINEKQSTSAQTAAVIAAVLFIAWGLLIVREFGFILVTILVAIIILLSSKTTGLAEGKIVYRSAVGGLAALAPRTQDFSNIKHISIQEKNDKLKMMLNINHRYTIYMQFALEDQDKIQKALEPYAPIEYK